MHYYQFNISDYQSHTKHLTPIEDICYRRLLDWQYMHEKPISTDTNSVCRLLMLRDYPTDVEQVLSEFFTLTDDGWINNRAIDEIQHFHEKSKKASEAGKASAVKRSLNTKSTNNQQDINKNEHEFNGRSTDVQPTINQELLTINHKPITNNQEPLTNKPINLVLKENIKEKPDSIRINLSEVTDQTFNDFLKLRNAKKSPLTLRAIENIRSEALKAGISLETALIECCARGWVGFKADWFMKTQIQNARASPPDRDEFNKRQTEIAKQKLFGISSKNEKDITHEARAL